MGEAGGGEGASGAQKAAESAPKRHAGGRPTRLSPAIQQKICDVLRDAGTHEQAAMVCGVGISTLMAWKSKGLKQERGKYREFVEALKKADEERVLRLETAIVRASRDHMFGADGKGNGGRLVEGDWRAALALLERIRPLQFAPRVYQHIHREYEDALDRLEKEFRNEPLILERALLALVGRHGPGAPLADEGGGHREDDPRGEAVLPAPAEPEAAPGPRAE